MPAEKIYMLASFILAISALGYSLYNGAEVGRRLKDQDEKIERHIRLSVQPNLAFGFYYNNEGSGWMLHNTGTGPAILKWFAVTVDGKYLNDWNAFHAALGLPSHVRYQFSVPYVDSVMPPTTDLDYGRLFWIPPGPTAESLKPLSRRVTMEVCYCSRYDECWLAGRDPRGPIRDSCKSPPTKPFRAPRK